ncbi:hypothetical protein B4098_2622 [Heyndrickxia coagulans]|uniref:Uncharacterized protein n=1 Tax=Heyndrickxia coagulans TaxID=1398 RepID=A0A150JQL0_HEYCO|nr:hypothetical protein B4098_2622 [Heyndrickxia coagulans]
MSLLTYKTYFIKKRRESNSTKEQINKKGRTFSALPFSL